MKSSIHSIHALHSAYRYFDRQLFQRTLPLASIGLDSSRSRFHSDHTFLKTASRYRSDEDRDDFHFSKGHEILLSSHLFLQKPLKLALSYLVREMVSVWQYESGIPSRKGYFNKEWSLKMESIGLVPTMDGKAGSKKTGQGVRHYLETGGKYELAFHLMYDSVKASLLQMNLPLPDSKEKKRQKAQSKNKRKYTCPACQQNVWGKAELYIFCGGCQIQMIELN